MLHLVITAWTVFDYSYEINKFWKFNSQKQTLLHTNFYGGTEPRIPRKADIQIMILVSLWQSCNQNQELECFD